MYDVHCNSDSYIQVLHTWHTFIPPDLTWIIPLLCMWSLKPARANKCIVRVTLFCQDRQPTAQAAIISLSINVLWKTGFAGQ